MYLVQAVANHPCSHLGSALGTLLNRRVRGSAVRWLFALLLVAVAGQMLYRAWSRGG